MNGLFYEVKHNILFMKVDKIPELGNKGEDNAVFEIHRLLHIGEGYEVFDTKFVDDKNDFYFFSVTMVNHKSYLEAKAKDDTIDVHEYMYYQFICVPKSNVVGEPALNTFKPFPFE